MSRGLLARFVRHPRGTVQTAWLGLRARRRRAAEDRAARRSCAFLRAEGLAPVVERRITGETAPLESLGRKATDLERLYRAVRRKRCRTVLEFGCGLSTIVMAAALRRNERKTGVAGRVWAVETAQAWTDLVRAATPPDLRPYLHITTADAELTVWDGQLCHIFSALPNVSPSLIYVDGPDSQQVKGEHRGLTFCDGRNAVAADVLLYESSLAPGAEIYVDGRVPNADFLRANLKRRYRVHVDRVHRVTRFVLR